jgi:hypothetical protein
MREWGWTNPVLCAEDGTIIAGHGRILAARQLAIEEVPVMVARGWTEAQRRAYVIADNKLAENGAWDEELLGFELDELREMEFDLPLIGFTRDELNDMIGTAGAAPDDSKGTLLELVNITIDEPVHVTEAGQVWRLGAHTLFVCSVIEDWAQWAPALKEGCLFCPFPGPLVFASVRAGESPLVMVQPDVYTAGHILDRYVDLYGEAQLSKVSP